MVRPIVPSAASRQADSMILAQRVSTLVWNLPPHLRNDAFDRGQEAADDLVDALGVGMDAVVLVEVGAGGDAVEEA